MTAGPERIARWRAQLHAARDTLGQRFLANPRPGAYLAKHSQTIDRLLQDIWRSHELPATAALVAVGGYGRSEMYPQSDVDVLILTGDDLTEAAHGRFEPLIALFWDVGLPIGHSVRRLSECLEESGKDITVQTNLLEARFLAGDKRLFGRFRQAFQAQLDPLAFFEAKLLEQSNRHGRFADRAMRLEPNLKESPGGLRDLQTVQWVAQAMGLPSQITALAQTGLLTAGEARRLNAAARLIGELRIRLHLAAKRREDRLLFEFQESLAQQFGLAGKGPRRAAELLMQRYYQAAREIGFANELLLGILRQRLYVLAKASPIEGAPGFLRRDNLLDLADEDLYAREPHAIFQTILTLQRQPELKGLAPNAYRALWRASRDIDAAFRRDPANRAAFLAIFREPRGVTLAVRLLHRLGLLGRYLPAFGRITGQLQHDLVHIYPVDEHTLMVLRNLRRLAVPELAHEFPLAHRLLREFTRPDLLYFAALFHDIAKGRGGDHSTLGRAVARRFCLDHGLAKQEAELVAWLVQEHLTLSRTAQKEDLSDPAVITAFARRCGTAERLTALYLLTMADIRATNPQIWNAWKDKLLRELYLSSRRALEGGAPVRDDIETRKQQARAALQLYGYEAGVEQALWSKLDDVYFLRHEAQEIAWQTRRLLPLLKREDTVVRARLAPIGEGAEVMVYAPDEAGLFARICGFFAAMQYTVLEARIHTTRDGHALDSFLVMDEANRAIPYRDLLSYIEYELAAALKAKRPLDALGGVRLSRQLKSFPIEPEIVLAPSDNYAGYVLSFTAGDRPGLLYDVARILAQAKVDVSSAKINTLGGRAEDVFVVNGEGLAQAGARLALEQALLGALKL
ncbi:MAG: [protein-PII] uridylyltransferase [Betaproteobacteria bacterium]|nr:[protein-PII] uridylyltransferase [Betaproteobacteria bacterium]